MIRFKSNKFMIAVSLVLLTLVGCLVAWMVFARGNVDQGLVAKNMKDCGGNTDCFYKSFNNNCTPASVKVSNLTIEGDPIITTASVKAEPGSKCDISVTVDGSQDRFGDGKIYHYTCEKLNRDKDHLRASDCDNKSSDDKVEVFL